jgi:nucleoid-associated protein YgaU
MKQDFKVGMVVGLVGLVVLLIGWVLLRGRPAPRSGYAQVPNMRMQEPNLPRPVYIQGSQPYAGTSVMTGVRPEPNAISGPFPAGTAPVPGASWPQAQSPSTPIPVPAAEATKPVRTHVVSEGESLSDIADHYYGSSDQWVKIHRANRSTIKDPDRIYPGMKLVIPD